MKVFLLAAGKGSRISKNIPEIPKSTLDVGGQPLILHTIKMLRNNGIDDITVVSGYKHAVIEDLLSGYNVNIVYNPFYDVTNSIASLWMAGNYIPDDESVLVANADVFWSQDILDQIMHCGKEVFMLSDVSRAEDGDYFFNTDSENRITGYGKDLSRENRTCEYVGIAYIGRSFVRKFMERLDMMVSSQQHGVWWENVLYSLVDEYDIFAEDVEGKFWAEVDFIEDYYRIIDYVEKSHNMR